MFARRPLLLLLIVFTIFLPFAKAQEPIDLRQAEDSLRILMQAVIDEKDIAKKFVSNQLFSDYLQSVLEKNEAFDYPFDSCLLYTSPSPRDRTRSRMPSSA